MVDIASTPPARFGRRVLGVALLALLGVAGFVFLGGPEPRAVSYGALSRYLFVQSLAAPEITVIDTSDDSVTGTIILPEVPAQVVVARVLDRILMSSRAARTIAIYDLASQTVESTIALPLVPDFMVLSPDGMILAVADRAAGKVGVIHLKDQSVKAVIEDYDRPFNLSFSNDSAYVFVPQGAAGQVGVIDAYSGYRLDPIAMSLRAEAAGDPEGSAVSAVTRTPNGLYGLLADRPGGAVSVINLRDWRESTTLQVGAGASRPYGSADGRYMMIASNADRTVTVLSTDGFRTEAVLPGLGDVTSIATGYFETLAYVVGSADKKALIIDLEEMKPAGEIDLGGTPGPAIVDAEGKRMYVALSDTNELLVIDVFAKEIIKRISGVGNTPHGVNLAATNNYCH